MEGVLGKNKTKQNTPKTNKQPPPPKTTQCASTRQFSLRKSWKQIWPSHFQDSGCGKQPPNLGSFSLVEKSTHQGIVPSSLLLSVGEATERDGPPEGAPWPRNRLEERWVPHLSWKKRYWKHIRYIYLCFLTTTCISNPRAVTLFYFYAVSMVSGQTG